MYTNEIINKHCNLINDIAHSLHEAYMEQRGSIAWLFQAPQKYKFLNMYETKSDRNVNLISVVDLLHLCYLSSTPSIYFKNGTFIENNSNIITNIKTKVTITWKEIIHKLISRDEIDLAIYTLAVKKFLRHKNIVLAYYTTMISDCKNVDFNQQVLLIDMECIKDTIAKTGKSLWRTIKDNDLLISKYENNNMERLNFWNPEYLKKENINTYETEISTINSDKYPQVYYKFIDIDKYTKNNIVNQNLLVRL